METDDDDDEHLSTTPAALYMSKDDDITSTTPAGVSISIGFNADINMCIRCNNSVIILTSHRTLINRKYSLPVTR